MSEDQKEPISVCRLCCGALKLRFTKQVLGKYVVSYYECVECQSLQTETPYWLNEAYETNLSELDTGAAQRNLDNLAVVSFLAKKFSAPNILDLGGGDGLLCRLLRDYGLNCYVQDKFATPTYAQGFTNPTFAHPDMVSAFEVLEHFADPKKELDQIFLSRPRIICITTSLYSGQGQDWWYLEPLSGQHIFFYSLSAMRTLADKYGYDLVQRGSKIIFLRSGTCTNFERWRLRKKLKNKYLRHMKLPTLGKPANGVAADHELLLQKISKAKAPRP